MNVNDLLLKKETARLAGIALCLLNCRYDLWVSIDSYPLVLATSTFYAAEIVRILLLSKPVIN